MSTMTHVPIISQTVVGGVDTHLDTHTAAAVTAQGVLLGSCQFPASPSGYRALAAWLASHGRVEKVGVEGTGAYGAGLTRYLHSTGVEVIEVNRPDRSQRRRQGKSDPLDAANAARAVLSGSATATPKLRDKAVEALRNLHVARKAALWHRADTQRRIRALIITVPEPLREQLRHLSIRELMPLCSRMRPGTDPTDPVNAAKTALRSLARTWQHLTEEINQLDTDIAVTLEHVNPRLLTVNGVGPAVATQLLITAGENPHRITDEAAFAMLCGAAPLPASSGKTRRHRLNRGGDRQAHSALWRIAITRMATDPRTKTYVEKRTKDGLSKREIIRCLIRYIAREIYRVLNT